MNFPKVQVVTTVLRGLSNQTIWKTVRMLSINNV